MIVFDLRCKEDGAKFEAWFRSGADYDDQSRQGLVQCPFCQSANVEKAPMAPRVSSRSSAGQEQVSAIQRLAQLQRKVLEGSCWVGDDFPNQARAIHAGDVEPRRVHGRATIEDVRSLAEEGVPVVPLPLPLAAPEQVN